MKNILESNDLSLSDKMRLFIQSNNVQYLFHYIKENNIPITKDIVCCWIIILCKLGLEEEIRNLNVNTFCDITNEEEFIAFQNELKETVSLYGNGSEYFTFFLINKTPFCKKLIIASIEGRLGILYVPYDFTEVQLNDLFAFLDKYDGNKLVGAYQCAIVKGFSENKKTNCASVKQGMYISLTELNKELYDFAENRDLEKNKPKLS